MARFPAQTDLGALLERLDREERELSRGLAALEERLRRFEDFEKPAYDSWVHLEFGPELQTLEELYQRIREKRILAERVSDLVEGQGLHPREALYHALGLGADEETESERERDPGGWDPDEVEARRRAKREAKREARREAKRESKRLARAGRESSQATGASGVAAGAARLEPPARRRVLALYRALARRLHPDSHSAVATLPEARVRTLWLEVQEAYETSNIERLLSIASWLEAEAAAEDVGEANGAVTGARRCRGGRTLSERYERISALARAHRRLQRQLDQLGAHPAWGFEAGRGSDRRRLRRAAGDEVGQRLARAQEALATLEDFIDSIGSPRKPKAQGRRR